MWIVAFLTILFSTASSTTSGGAAALPSLITKGCNENAVTEIQNHLMVLDRSRTASPKLDAELRIELARRLAACYIARRDRQSPTGSSPLLDLSNAAVSASVAASEYLELRDQKSACASYHYSSSLFDAVNRDGRSYGPVWIDDSTRRAASQGKAKLLSEFRGLCTG